MEKEAITREREINNVRTLYIGGGTPSLLDADDIEKLIVIGKAEDAVEKTLEANPQDITYSKAAEWRKIGINRLSIGIQSFNDDYLRLLGRRHNAWQALSAVETAQRAGFDNISIDLIYALPGQTLKQCHEDIETALSLDIQHLSCYCLSFEEGTPFADEKDAGVLKETDDDTANEMYDLICDKADAKGIKRYEVSNFAKKCFEAKHNSSYWDHTPYTGLGAGAHSFDGRHTRRANICNLDRYIAHPDSTEIYTIETLTAEDLYNEKIMLGLRTSRGIDRQTVHPSVLKAVERHLADGCLAESDGKLTATQKGIHILNEIITDLMI